MRAPRPAICRLPILLLLFLLLGTAASGLAAPEPTWVPDVLQQLQQQGSSEEDPVGVSAYGAAEDSRERGCLRLKEGVACQCGPGTGCFSQIITQDMGCCTPAGDYPDASDLRSVLLDTTWRTSVVGQCTWQAIYADDFRLQVGPNIWFTGTLSFTCELNARAHKCGSPFSDGMALTGFVKEYFIEGTNTNPVYTRGILPYQGVEANPGGTCKPLVRVAGAARNMTRSRGGHHGRRDDHSTPVPEFRGLFKDRPARAASSSYHSGVSQELYPAQEAGVVVGSFFVTNSRRNTKYTTGKLQYVQVYEQDPTQPPVRDPSPNAMIFKPWDMDLLFDSRESY